MQRIRNIDSIVQKTLDTKHNRKPRKDLKKEYEKDQQINKTDFLACKKKNNKIERKRYNSQSLDDRKKFYFQKLQLE